MSNALPLTLHPSFQMEVACCVANIISDVEDRVNADTTSNDGSLANDDFGVRACVAGVLAMVESNCGDALKPHDTSNDGSLANDDFGARACVAGMLAIVESNCGDALKPHDTSNDGSLANDDFGARACVAGMLAIVESNCGDALKPHDTSNAGSLADDDFGVRACVAGLLARVESNCGNTLKPHDASNDGSLADDDFGVRACVAGLLARVESNCDNTLKTYGVNALRPVEAECLNAVENLFNLTSDLSVLFGPPFLPDNCPSDFSEKFKAAVLSSGHGKSSTDDIIGIYRGFLNFWMRLACIDPFELREPYGDSLCYSGPLKTTANEKRVLKMVDSMFKKMPNATDRLISRYLLAAVAKTGVNVIRGIIFRRDDVELKQALTRPYQKAILNYELQFRSIFAKENDRLLSDLTEFYGDEKGLVSCHKHLLRFDRRSVAFTLYFLQLYLTKKGSKSHEQNLTVDLETNPKISQVDLYARFKRKRYKSLVGQSEVSKTGQKNMPNGLNAQNPKTPENNGEMPKIPPYRLVKFATRLPPMIAAALIDGVSQPIDATIAAYQSFAGDKVQRELAYLPRSFVELRASLCVYIRDLARRPALTGLLSRYHVCAEKQVCSGVLRQFWDPPYGATDAKWLEGKRILKPIGRMAFFKVAQTVVNLGRYLEQLFATKPAGNSVDKPRDFSDFCAVVGLLLAHLYLLLYAGPAHKVYVKIIIRKVHETLSSCRQIAEKHPVIVPFAAANQLYPVRSVLVLANRVAIRFSYILSLLPHNTHNERIPFGTVPADQLLNCPIGFAEKALEQALEIKSRSSANSLSANNRVAILMRSISLRKRAALDVTLALNLVENVAKNAKTDLLSQRFDKPDLLSQCFEPISKRLFRDFKTAKSLFASVEKMRKASDASKELAELSRILSETQLTIMFVLKQLKERTPSLEAMKLDDVILATDAAKDSKKRELQDFQKSVVVSRCFAKGDPLWRFFLQDFFQSHFSPHLAKWFEGAEFGLRPPHFQCDSESKICHLAGIVLTLYGRGLPPESAGVTLERPAASASMCVSAKRESPMIEATKRLAANPHSYELMAVLRFHADWLLRGGIEGILKNRTADLLTGRRSGTAAAEGCSWTILYLHQVGAALESVRAGCASDFFRLANLYRMDVNSDMALLAVANFWNPSWLVWANTNVFGGGGVPKMVAAGKTAQPEVVGRTKAAQIAKTGQAHDPTSSANRLSTIDYRLKASIVSKTGSSATIAATSPTGSTSTPTTSTATGASELQRWASQGKQPIIRRGVLRLPTVNLAASYTNNPGGSSSTQSCSMPTTSASSTTLPPMSATMPSIDNSIMRSIENPIGPPSTGGSMFANVAFPPPPVSKPFLYAHPPPFQSYSFPPPNVGNSDYASTAPLPLKRRGSSSLESEGSEPKRARSEKSEPNESVLSLDDILSSQEKEQHPDLILVQFLAQLQALRSVTDELRVRQREEFGDPEFLAKLFAGHSRTGEDVLEHARSIDFLSTNTDFSGELTIDIMNRTLFLEQERTHLKRVLDSIPPTPELDAANLENQQLSRHLAILVNLIAPQHSVVATDCRANDFERIACDVYPYLNDLRGRCEKSAKIDRTLKAFTFEAIKTVFARVLPRQSINWSSSLDIWGIIRHLKILAETFLSLKNDIERMKELLSSVKETVADRDARIADLESRLWF